MPADDDDLLADLGKKPRKIVPSARTASRPMRRLMLGGRLLGGLLGASVSIVGLMAVAGALTDSLIVRALFAVVFAVVLPAFLADRVLRVTREGGISLVVDVVTITLLALALGLVAASGRTSRWLVDEGDRHARDGSRVLARFAYFVGGVSPRFPGDEGYRAPRPARAPEGPDGGAP